ncbi:MAG: hypothetical protein GYA43_11855 [Bacteroidales bacterium]|nr:hypothetical protein [Bacteroidales bacterium]
MKKYFIPVLLVVLFIPFFQGCEKKGNPPVVPPEGTMIMDFSNFTDGSKSAYALPGTKGAEDVNYSVAKTVVGVWNTLLFVNLAIPVAAFRKAVENKPSYLDNKKWQWKYTVNVLSATYTARLTGQITSSDVKWEMYISRDGVGGFPEFLWFKGTTALDGKSGQWIMNESRDAQVPMLQIDWQISGTDVGSVKYTYIKTGNPFKDSYIEYGLATGTYNAFYNVHFYESTSYMRFVDVNIEWSTTGHNGRIKAQDYFGDTAWHCWDGNGNDITCP